MKLRSGVKWRAYGDGVVVYVPATCETHVLAPELADIICSRTAESSGPAGGVDSLAVDFTETSASGVADQFIDELIALKILDAST